MLKFKHSKFYKQIKFKFIYVYIVQAVDTTVLGLSKDEAEKKPYIASMGVYVFKKEILLNLLRYNLCSVTLLTSKMQHELSSNTLSNM